MEGNIYFILKLLLCVAIFTLVGYLVGCWLCRLFCKPCSSKACSSNHQADAPKASSAPAASLSAKLSGEREAVDSSIETKIEAVESAASSAASFVDTKVEAAKDLALNSIQPASDNIASSLAAVAAVVASGTKLDNATHILGKRVLQDDFKIIEGIGAKIEELIKDAGIKTWLELSEAPVERIQSILDAAGKNYSIHNPGTWPRQAGMAATGKWQELLAWQATLDGGKEIV